MGEHTEETAKEWHISREAQDEWALKGHQRVIAARARGFFDDLIIPVGATDRDTVPRADTSMEKLTRLPPAFDRVSGQGSLTAGNSSPVTDGAASVWVATKAGLARLPDNTPFAHLVDFEITSVDLQDEGLLMAPSYSIPRLMERHKLRYEDIALWEIHEAFAAQVLANVAALEDRAWIKNRHCARLRCVSLGARQPEWQLDCDRTPRRRRRRADQRIHAHRSSVHRDAIAIDTFVASARLARQSTKASGIAISKRVVMGTSCN
jgi:Thiolase, N-terminal domain/Thiolase, C-terminal domain